MQPTWWDHHNLNFWPWACIHSAQAFLASSAKFWSVAGATNQTDFREHHMLRLEAQQLMELYKYHFIMTAGSLAKRLTDLVPMFPSVQPAYDAAQHFRKEVLYIRNMVEHSEINIRARQEGKPRGGFERKNDLLDNFPGDQRGIADATAMIVDAKGHWLGGRLNVEKVISEVMPILTAAQAIPAPEPAGLPLPPGAPSNP